MKLFFSLLLLSHTAFAGRFLISHTISSKKYVSIVKRRLIDKYNIPEGLIHTREVKNCKSHELNFIEICLNNNDLYILRNKNMELLKSSISVFYKKGFTK